jgi:C4-type Zn-finger protein
VKNIEGTLKNVKERVKVLDSKREMEGLIDVEREDRHVKNIEGTLKNVKERVEVLDSKREMKGLIDVEREDKYVLSSHYLTCSPYPN